MSKYCDFFAVRKQSKRCYPLEIIGKDEKGTGKFICLYCNLPVELEGLEEYKKSIA